MISLPLVGAFALAWWIPQNIQHECAHAIVARRFGAVITKIWPLPGMVDGQWLWAYVQYIPVVKFTPSQDALVSAAPILTNTIMLILYSWYAAFMVWSGNSGSLVINSLLAAVALNNYIDGAVWVSTFYRTVPKMSTDGWKFWKATGLSVYMMRFMPIWWHLTFGVLLLTCIFL